MRKRSEQAVDVAKKTECAQVINTLIDNTKGHISGESTSFSPSRGIDPEKEYEKLKPWAQVVGSRLRVLAVTIGRAQEAIDEILRAGPPK